MVVVFFWLGGSRLAERLELNRKELASLLGVSLPTVTDWIERGLPVLQRGARGVPWKFDAAECVSWMRDFDATKAAAGSDIGEKEAQRRILAADAQTKEINLAELQRKVVRIEDVDRIWEGRVVAARETLLPIAKRLAPELVGEEDRKEIEARIRDEIERGLTDLSEWEEDEPLEEEDEEEDS